MGITSKRFGRSVGDLDVVMVPVSFEAGEIGTVYVDFPYPVTIVGFTATVTKALGATDTGTITGANSVGNSTAGVITAAISAALGTRYAKVVPTSNNTVATGSYYSLTTAKTTAGGKAVVCLQYKRA